MTRPRHHAIEHGRVHEPHVERPMQIVPLDFEVSPEVQLAVGSPRLR